MELKNEVLSRGKAIEKTLKRPALSTGELKALATTLAEVEAEGFDLTEVFPIGIIDPDGAQFTFRVDPDRVGLLIEKLSSLNELRPEYRIFPIGILAPDHFMVETSIGRRNTIATREMAFAARERR